MPAVKPAMKRQKIAAPVYQSQEQWEAVMTLLFDAKGKCRVSMGHASGCWHWLGARAANGYGRIGVKGSVLQAHRFAYITFRGEIDDTLDLDHLCRNRMCVNPWHQEPVTRAINARRGSRSKLTEKRVAEIRQRYAAGGVTQKQLGAEYGVDNSIISEIVTGKIWR